MLRERSSSGWKGERGRGMDRAYQKDHFLPIPRLRLTVSMFWGTEAKKHIQCIKNYVLRPGMGDTKRGTGKTGRAVQKRDHKERARETSKQSPGHLFSDFNPLLPLLPRNTILSLISGAKHAFHPLSDLESLTHGLDSETNFSSPRRTSPFSP